MQSTHSWIKRGRRSFPRPLFQAGADKLKTTANAVGTITVGITSVDVEGRVESSSLEGGNALSGNEVLSLQGERARPLNVQ